LRGERESGALLGGKNGWMWLSSCRIGRQGQKASGVDVVSAKTSVVGGRDQLAVLEAVAAVHGRFGRSSCAGEGARCG
jgi:hypothetical protein